MGELQEWIRKSLDNLVHGGDEVIELVTPDGIKIRISGDLRANINLMDETGDMLQDAVRVGEKAGDGGEALKGVSGALEGGSKTFKFSDMTESEITKIVEEYRKKAPIEIPDTARYKAKSMVDGYEQISYKWNDGTYKYEVRWHTRTSGAPEGQGNTWVIQRTIPGNGGTKPSTQFLIGENEWVEGWKWYDAINARKNGIATQE